MSAGNDFLHWSLDTRDIDRLIVAVLLADAIQLFTGSITSGLVSPLMRAFVLFKNPTLNVNGNRVEVDVVEVTVAFIRLVFMLFVCYLLVRYRVVS